jgi:hypothetical protein
MTNYIFTNSSLLVNKIDKLINLSEKKENNIHCDKCNYISENDYKYNDNGVNIKFKDLDKHMVQEHNMIDYNLYEKISKTKINFTYEYIYLSTNNINVIDGLYEDGSKNKYIEPSKNIFTGENFLYSEHYGSIEYEKNKVSNFNIYTDMRVDKEDPNIFLPKSRTDLVNFEYIFHTHPKTPYLGSRIKYNLLYEFPSISDILHFIDNHNNGKLLGSLVLAPEGLYHIHKYIFNKEEIKLDFFIFMDELDYELRECYLDAKKEYSKINYKKLMRNNEIKIPESYFYKNISLNFDYVNRINMLLAKYDLYIDFYPRIRLSNTKNWILPDIYLPII